MFKNYFKTAVRSLLRHRFFSAINIAGLAVSMVVSMAIIMLVADQMMYDRYNTSSTRIYRINTVPVGQNGEEWNETATTVFPLKQKMLDGYTGVESSVRLMRGFANNWLELEQNVNVPVHGYFADPELFDFFEYELEYGDPRTALVEPFSVVLTKKAARKLFRQQNPVGEMLRVTDKEIYKVTGVLRETNNKSHIVFEALASMATVQSQEASGKKKAVLDDWFNYTLGWTYIKIEKGKRPADILSNLNKIGMAHYEKLLYPDTQQKLRFTIQNILAITPGPFINNPIGPFLPWILIYFFAGIAAVVMLTSCFNFTNLSIARSISRAREIGVRKVTGAKRWQIFTQFLSESVIVAMLSLVLAFILVLALKPMILQLSFARIMMWDLQINLVVIAVFIGFALVVGLMAGVVPAFVLSAFKPIKVLKNLSALKLFSRMGLRKTLLTAQFTFSLIFILTVLVVFEQLNLFLHADHGFNLNNKIALQLNNTSVTALKTELLKYNSIESVSASSHIPAAGTTKAIAFKRALDDKDWTMLDYYATDEDYLKNMGLVLIAGKFYDAESASLNEHVLVINEKAVHDLNFKSADHAIGQELILKSDSSVKRIIGVVRNYHHQFLMEKMQPLALIYMPKEFALLQVAYGGTYAEAGKIIEAAWLKINPSLKVDYKDFSEEIHKMYNILFGDAGDILGVVSFLAILISSLGLLGMATYATETRKKEIAIRKVLGSHNGALVYLLSKGFFAILLTAVLIAVPSAWAMNNLWLELMPYHVTINAEIIFTGVVILLAFGLITVGSQTYRAARVNPVQNLKE